MEAGMELSPTAAATQPSPLFPPLHSAPPPSPCSVLSAQTGARSKRAQQNSAWTHFSGCADTSETGRLF